MLGAISALIIMFLSYRLYRWVVENEEIRMNPKLIEGMEIPPDINMVLNMLIVLAIIGVVTGICGIVKDKKSISSLIGSLIHGLLLLIYAIKL